MKINCCSNTIAVWIKIKQVQKIQTNSLFYRFDTRKYIFRILSKMRQTNLVCLPLDGSISSSYQKLKSIFRHLYNQIKLDRFKKFVKFIGKIVGQCCLYFFKQVLKFCLLNMERKYKGLNKTQTTIERHLILLRYRLKQIYCKLFIFSTKNRRLLKWTKIELNFGKESEKDFLRSSECFRDTGPYRQCLYNRRSLVTTSD